MFKIKDPQTQKDVVVFELCDKEYRSPTKSSMVRKDNYPLLGSYLFKLRTAKEEIEPIPTLVEELDKILDNGLRPGLYILGANPGLGKTSLMLHIALNLATKKHHILYFNLEMSTFQITTKLLANLSYRKSLEDNSKPMTISQLSKSSLFNSKTGKMDSSLEDLCNSNIDVIANYFHCINYTDENDCRFIESIETALLNCRECHHMRPVVVVDFIQLLKIKPEYGSNNEVTNQSLLLDKRLETNEVIERLKKLSNKYHLPIFGISSLSRGAYTKDNTELTDYAMSAFKESGHIEYTADFLALLTRGDDNVNFGSADTKTIYINVLKNRYGTPDAKIQLEFIPGYSYFKDVTEKYEEDEEDE